MAPEYVTYHFVYRVASGQILLKTDANISPPRVGAIVHFPSLTEDQQIIAYRISDVQFVAEGRESVTVYIEVEPLRP
jgi:hypothetical protein